MIAMSREAPDTAGFPARRVFRPPQAHAKKSKEQFPKQKCAAHLSLDHEFHFFHSLCSWGGFFHRAYAHGSAKVVYC